MKIVFISDTEDDPILLGQWLHLYINKFLRRASKNIHLGDGVKNIKGFLSEFNMIYIKGNHDKNSDVFRKRKVINVDGFRILLVHGDREDKIAEQLNICMNMLRHFIGLPPLLSEYYSKLFIKYKGKYDLVAYGHMHIPRIDIIGNTIFFCPGSLSLKKSFLNTKPSFGVLEIKPRKKKKYLVFDVFSLLLKKRSPRVIKTLTKKIIWQK